MLCLIQITEWGGGSSNEICRQPGASQENPQANPQAEPTGRTHRQNSQATHSSQENHSDPSYYSGKALQLLTHEMRIFCMLVWGTDWSCTWGMVQTNIHLIGPGCAYPSISTKWEKCIATWLANSCNYHEVNNYAHITSVLTVQNHDLERHQSFPLSSCLGVGWGSYTYKFYT